MKERSRRVQYSHSVEGLVSEQRRERIQREESAHIGRGRKASVVVRVGRSAVLLPAQPDRQDNRIEERGGVTACPIC